MINPYPPFSKYTAQTLWNTPYISKQMLRYHLDQNTEAASRSFDKIKRTVQFIISEFNLNSKSHICDFGCGPGLYTNLYQKHGIKTSGVDFSESSIKYAQSQNQDVQYILGNYLTINTNETYDLITQIYMDFCVLSPEQVSQLLNNIKRHLKPGGILFFDVSNMTFYQNMKEGTTKRKEVDGFFMEGPCDITCNTFKYPDLKLILEHQLAVGKETIEIFNWFQCYTKESIQRVLEQNGFKVLSFYNNTYGANEPEKDHFVVACKVI